MKIKITTLTENTANYGVIAEWGLSLLVEVDDYKILMDTGLGRSVAYNAKAMSVDLSKIDCIVISHGHADHTGGLKDVLQIRGKVDIYAHPDIWTDKHAGRGPGVPPQRIGVPFPRAELEALGAKFHLSKGPFYLKDNILTTGEVPLQNDFEEIENNLFVKENGELKPDPLADDLSLIIKAEFGLVVIAGCAHRGIINTIRHAQQITGEKKVYAVIGGIHLVRAGDERIFRTIAELQEIGVQKLGVSHCTGFKASARLAEAFGNIFFLNNAGSRFVLP